MARNLLLRVNVLVGALVLSFWMNIGWTQRLTWLGTLGGSRSEAHGVSRDGSVVVGWAYNAFGQTRAFRWTVDTGIQEIAVGTAYGVSADGQVVVGVAEVGVNQIRAFRWTQAGGLQSLGSLGGVWSEARGVSADGAVVSGWSLTTVSATYRAFRWTQFEGMQDIGSLSGSSSWGRGLSADGSVVVGEDQNRVGRLRAFRWSAATGMQDLGTLGGYQSGARGVSADGLVVVGWATLPGEIQRAFRWTPSGGMQALGSLGSSSEALSVSGDGSVVVGRFHTAGTNRAFRWTASGGMENLNLTYASLLTDGSILFAANSISADGRFIVGYGWNATTLRTEAFLLDTVPEPASLIALGLGLIGLVRRRCS